MLYLLLAILCSSSIALIFKFSESNNLDRYVVTTTNYLTASFISLLLIIVSFINGDLQPIQIPKTSLMLAWSIAAGIIAGAFFFLSFVYYQRSVRENGASLSGTFGKLGILIPMLFSVVLWKEYPSLLQWIGISLSIIAIIIANLNLKKGSFEKMNFTLLLLFAFGGIAEFSNKIFQKYCAEQYKNIFLLFVFLTAFLISLTIVLKRQSKIRKIDIITGLLVGVPNLFSSFFLISALNTIKESIAFPVYSAGSIILITTFSSVFFKETLKLKDTVSIIITIISLVLINL